MSDTTPSPEAPETEPTQDEKLLEGSIRARQKFWKRYGQIESGVLTALNNPVYMGGPKWPALRPSFVRVKRTNSVLIASDGLSDPWPGEEAKGQGFGLELFMESRDKDLRSKSWEELKASWFFQTLYNVAQTAAHKQDFHQILAEDGLFSMELGLVNAPAHLMNKDERVGVLVGVEPKSITPELRMPLAKIKLAAVMLLTPDELAYSIAEGLPGQKKLNKLLRKRGYHHFSSVERPSVVK